MAPKKQPQRKRARAETGSASTPAPRGLTGDALKKYRTLSTGKLITPNAFLNMEVIHKYGLTGDFEHLLQDRAWFNLFSINEPIYKGVTLEVMATFKIQKPDRFFGLDNEISFNAFGINYSMSMREFCEHTGLYSPNEVHHNDFQRLPTQWPSNQLTYAQFWSSIGKKTYNPSVSKASRLRNSSHRILHSLLVHSLNGKLHSTGVVSQQDLYPLWSMINNVRVNVAVELAFAIRQQAHLKKKGLFCGAYITRILKNMQVFPDEPPENPLTNSYPMTDAALRQWGIPKPQEAPISSEEDEQEGTSSRTSQQLKELTVEVKKLKKKNKSLKRYIGTIAEAFAKKLKVKLPDCISSSSSSSDGEDTEQQGEGSQVPAEGEEESDSEREVVAASSDEAEEEDSSSS